MARQMGPIIITGTIGNITFYKLGDIGYAKGKSSLTGNRVKTDPTFRNTMRNSEWFGQATSLTKHVYRELPFETPDRFSNWHPMRNRAQVLVREGIQPSEIIHLLRMEFIEPLKKKYSKAVVSKSVSIARKLPAVSATILQSSAMNKSMEMKLVDQLAASCLFIKNILIAKKQGMWFSVRDGTI